MRRYLGPRWHLRRTPNTTITIITAGTAIIIGIATNRQLSF
jgi:hypothetical protein